jgi:hypothetical protein
VDTKYKVYSNYERNIWKIPELYRVTITNLKQEIFHCKVPATSMLAVAIQ